VLPVTETAGVIPVLEKSFDRLRALLPEVHHGLIDAHQTLVTTLAAKHCDPAHVIETVNPVLADLIAALEDNREIVLDELIADLVETTRDILSGVAMKDLGLLLEAGRRSTALAMASGFL
jgi:adenylate kinase